MHKEQIKLDKTKYNLPEWGCQRELELDAQFIDKMFSDGTEV